MKVLAQNENEPSPQNRNNPLNDKFPRLIFGVKSKVHMRLTKHSLFWMQRQDRMRSTKPKRFIRLRPLPADPNKIGWERKRGHCRQHLSANLASLGKFIGVGEGIDDLEPFQPENFVNALFEM
jgi:hypothetical protein